MGSVKKMTRNCSKVSVASEICFEHPNSLWILVSLNNNKRVHIYSSIFQEEQTFALMQYDKSYIFYFCTLMQKMKRRLTFCTKCFQKIMNIKYFLDAVFASLPRTIRGMPVSVNASPNGEVLVYCNGNSVFLRDLKVS